MGLGLGFRRRPGCVAELSNSLLLSAFFCVICVICGYRFMCRCSGPPFAISLDQKIPATLCTELKAVGGNVADADAGAVLVELWPALACS